VRSIVVADLVACTFFWQQVSAHWLAQLRIHDPAPIQRTKKARAKNGPEGRRSSLLLALEDTSASRGRGMEFGSKHRNIN
jgi:hypothetical protein